jgi:hypothetical protein
LLPYAAGLLVPLRQRGDPPVQGLETLIAEAVRSRYLLDLPQETIPAVLRDKRVVVIFDGLDEVHFSSRGQAVLDIIAFCDAYPTVKVVVSSRPGAAGRFFRPAQFPSFEIAPLTDSDVTAYVNAWGEVTSTGQGPMLSLEELSSSEVRQGWLSTPLLMAQLMATYDRTNILPRQEIDLYDMMYSVLFESRDSLRGITRTPLSPQMTGLLVSYLCYELKARGDVQGAPDSDFHLLLQASGEYTGYRVGDIEQIADTLADLDLPIRRTLADGEHETRWSVTRDSFSDYLAARWISGLTSLNDITSKLMTMIKAEEFTAGGQFIAQFAKRRHTARQIARYLHHVLDHDAQQLSESTRAAIIQMLSILN